MALAGNLPGSCRFDSCLWPRTKRKPRETGASRFAVLPSGMHAEHARQVGEYRARLAIIAGPEVAATVHAQALAAGDEALRWAQSMPYVLNSWAWWDAVSWRFEQAVCEAMAGRDPLGDKPVHHRWGVPLTAAQARDVDDATARAYAAGVPFAASGMADLLSRTVPPPPTPPLPDFAAIKRALAEMAPDGNRRARRAQRAD